MLKLFAVFIALAQLQISSSSGSATINYDEQENWGGVCNKDTSKKQSPVNVILPWKGTIQNGARVIELSGKLLRSEKQIILTLHSDPKQFCHIELKMELKY